jgi:hypothetical protein
VATRWGGGCVNFQGWLNHCGFRSVCLPCFCCTYTLAAGLWCSGWLVCASPGGLIGWSPSPSRYIHPPMHISQNTHTQSDAIHTHSLSSTSSLAYLKTVLDKESAEDLALWQLCLETSIGMSFTHWLQKGFDTDPHKIAPTAHVTHTKTTTP